MSFSPEDLAQLGEFLAAQVDEKVTAAVADVRKDLGTEVPAKPPVAGSQAADAEVEYYVHLADGKVVTMPQNEVASHVDGVQVIGKYRIGA
jgi:hypothetical protein